MTNCDTAAIPRTHSNNNADLLLLQKLFSVFPFVIYSSSSAVVKSGPQRRPEAQLTLTNPRDAFRGQSRSPNMVPFHMLGMVSYQGATVTLS